MYSYNIIPTAAPKPPDILNTQNVCVCVCVLFEMKLHILSMNNDGTIFVRATAQHEIMVVLAL